MVTSKALIGLPYSCFQKQCHVQSRQPRAESKTFNRFRVGKDQIKIELLSIRTASIHSGIHLRSIDLFACDKVCLLYIMTTPMSQQYYSLAEG
jgi:hypothetical protein